MGEAQRLADLVDRVLDGDCWHGPNVLAILDGLDADDAASTAVPGAHSIWEIVLHMTGWADEVRARLNGAEAGEPAVGDWPTVADPSPASWARSVMTLIASHRALAAAIRRAGDDALAVPVVDHRDRAAGTGLSKYLTLHGLVHHTVYHAGQLALLRRALESARS
jgi:DinB superfamily